MSTNAAFDQTTCERAFESLRWGVRPVVQLVEDAPEGAVPRLSYLTGGYDLTPRYLPHAWATFQWTGFLCGRLWLLADYFQDSRIHDAAHKLASVVAAELEKGPPGFSAAGSDLFYAVCLGARVSGDERLAEAGLRAVRRYAENFDENRGVFFQVRGVNRAVVDTGMNLLPFYWAADREEDLSELAVSHNTNMLRYGIVRGDGSTFQAIEFDETTGEPRRRFNMQGYSDETTWARGQAWALHNYVNVFEATGDPQFGSLGVEQQQPERVGVGSLRVDAGVQVPVELVGEEPLQKRREVTHHRPRTCAGGRRGPQPTRGCSIDTSRSSPG